MKYYDRNGAEVEAVQVTPNSDSIQFSEMTEWLSERIAAQGVTMSHNNSTGVAWVTFGSGASASPGDWLIEGSRGSVVVVPQEEFDKHYSLEPPKEPEGLKMKYFTLSPEGDTPYHKASRQAMLVYASVIHSTNPKIATDLIEWVERLKGGK